jgi:hypothetical protein
MAWATVKLLPGLNVEITPTMNTAGYSQTQLGRFKSGLFQKIGGWTKFYPVKVDGVPKAIHTWKDLAGNVHFCMGTTDDVDVITNGSYVNIQPQVLTTNPAINFATTINTPLVTIVDTAVNNITAYDSVYFNTPVSVGGLILSGLYQVTANITATSYTITAASNATATVVSPGGSIPSFTTTLGNANVTVTFAGHGLLAGDDIVFPIATTVGGITIQGRYVVQSVIDANNFTITCTSGATSAAGPTAMNGGAAQFLYYIAIGPQAASGGYGTSTYGSGPYGIGTPIVGQTGTGLAAVDWSLDNWGELLLACPEGGGLYYWGPASGYSNMAIVSQGPVFNQGMFVSTNQQFVIMYGSTQEAVIGVYQDPLLVKWCDAGDFFNWTLSATTQAGSYRLSSGSGILAGASTQLRNLLWTDKDLWVSSYIGSSLVFNMVKVGEGSGIIGKHAWGKIADSVFWMGQKNFFLYDNAGPRILDCTVWDAVFQDLDLTNASKSFVGVNKAFSEIFFFFPSASGGLGYPDKYAKFNIQENAWDYGPLQRNAWRDSDVLSYPVAATNDGFIYYHENGLDADGTPLNAYFQTGYFYIDEGREKVFVDRVYPDFKWGQYNGSQNAQLLVTFYVIDEMGDTPSTYGPFTVTAATNFIEPRFRGRQIAMRVESQDVGSFWRLGAVRFRFSPDGRSGGY